MALEEDVGVRVLLHCPELDGNASGLAGLKSSSDQGATTCPDDGYHYPTLRS